MSTPGFYGKLAVRGDFIHRGLSPAFIEAWDAWLAAGLAASRETLGEAWLDAYLVSPLWRFAVAPGLLGPDAVCGVMMPSVDRVGRYFPLTIALPLPADADIGQLVSSRDDWFERAEGLLLSTLNEGADAEAFERSVEALGSPLPATSSEQRRDASGATIWPVDTPQDRGLALMQQAWNGASLWWGHGSERVTPGLVRFTGLPPAQAFCRLLSESAGGQP
ncbi:MULTISPECIES: type VI secretion system-associated protein TagF [Pseudomonas]|uniref:Type VI secretion system protein ImpM n=1 Tax=Pseudomonas straminea TaxID=47882 RepID=A0A1I1S121_PSEOC|nr:MULTISPECIES: type VI secretion system-associated protein TagF [Pseudomonas]OLU23978.1 type VI secretion-associated protein [Pseudomonas sp. PA27(2017)]GLX12099.1 type VI secretion-associated protein [Pseudomonas straminea]SFD38248.1 type VI secretion system protein ImpM [Pseudomonas straminea]